MVNLLAKSPDLGRARRIDGVHDRYIEFAKRTLPRNLSLEGLRVADIMTPELHTVGREISLEDYAREMVRTGRRAHLVVAGDQLVGLITAEALNTVPQHDWDVTSVQAETQPGWSAKLDRDPASGIVHSVTWTAAPHGGIPVDQFGLFQISVKLPDTDTVSFLFTIYPALRWIVALCVVALVPLVVFTWRADPFRVRRVTAIAAALGG